MANNGQKLQKVGVIKTGGQIVDVLYVGGSMFMLDFPTEAGKKPAMIDKSRIDMLVEKNQLKLTSEDVYNRICENIDPVTGETRDYHADGTKKTEVERVLHQLNEERSTRSDRSESEKKEPEHGRVVAPLDDEYGNEVPGVADQSASHSMTRSRPQPQPQAAEFSQDDIFGDMGGAGTATVTQNPSQPDFGFPQTPSEPQGMQRVDGPGVPATNRRDEQQSLKTAPAKRRGAVLGAIAVTLTGCVACFAVTSSVIRGIGLRVADIPVIGQFLADPNDRRNLPIDEQVRPGEKQETTATTSGMEVVVRSDFDPEDQVVQFAIADDASQDLALKFFQAIRVAYSEGNLTQLNSMIAYDHIHGQIAGSYAAAEQQRLGLSEEAKNTLASQYVAIMNQREGDHVASHDLDASIYCGRIREVRVDDNDPNKLYVVMESLGGDHQRACFVLQGDGTGLYALTEMVDSDGYVRMIMEGTI